MNTKRFNELFDETIEKSRSVLCSKAAEYAENDDRLHNFQCAAKMQGCTEIRALGGIMAKHTISVYDLINRTDIGLAVSHELWDEKIIDSINYLILLRAAVEDWEAEEIKADMLMGLENLQENSNDK